MFLSATEWDKTAPIGDDTGGFTAWSAMYSSRGYTSIEIDLKPPTPMPATSEELMKHFVDGQFLTFLPLPKQLRLTSLLLSVKTFTELSQQVRLTGIPFPPVIHSRSYTSLIAQAYISDHPCHGLFLLSPPAPSANTGAYEPDEAPTGMLPTALPEFNYEPYFHIGVMLTSEDVEKGFEKLSRLGRDEGGKVELLQATADVDGSGNESSRLVSFCLFL